MVDKIAGCLFGAAFGDAMGAETEFLNFREILQQFPPLGPQQLMGNPARVTDDTQMMLAVGKALIESSRPYEPQSLAHALTDTFSVWHDDPENNRAPGITCMSSIRRLKTGKRWQEATNMTSKGCGANMRVQPVGLLPGDAVRRAQVAQLQAALTHAHPTALAAADLTAWVIAELLHADTVDDLLVRTRAYAISQRRVYHETWLVDLYTQALGYMTGSDYIQAGWDECIAMLAKVEHALVANRLTADACQLVGAGWIAEEAFATALYCFLEHKHAPIVVLRRATSTSGDSDSIACIAGAFAGAYSGLSAFPADWVQRIEYRDALNQIVDALAHQWRLD